MKKGGAAAGTIREEGDQMLVRIDGLGVLRRGSFAAAAISTVPSKTLRKGVGATATARAPSAAPIKEPQSRRNDRE